MSKWTESAFYKSITLELLATIPDNQLVQVLFDQIWHNVGEEYSRLEQVLAEMPAGYSTLYYLVTMHGELGNGGFNQYFFNGYDSKAEQQLEALNAIGATDHIQIFHDAFSLHETEKDNEELQELYEERTLESFFSTYAITGLGSCDERWFALYEQFESLLVQFIRQHLYLFVYSRQ